MTTIGTRIYTIRKARGLTQDELAKKSGKTQSSIAYLESDGPKVGSSSRLAAIARALNVNADWLETGEGSPELDYVPQAESYCKEIEEVIKLMKSTDDRGRRKALIAVEDVVEAHLARKNSLPRAQQPEEDEAGYVNRLAQEVLPEIIESEKLANDVYMPDNGGARKDKRH